MAEDQDCPASDLMLEQTQDLCKSLYAMRTEDEADVILTSGNEQFPAHKLVLIANSEYFRGMFRSDMLEATSGKIVFKEMEPEILEIVLDFMYLGDVSKIIRENVLKVLTASDLLQLEKLFQFCCQKLLTELTPKNFLDTWNAAEKYERSDFCTDVLSYVFINIKDIVQDENFLILSHSKLRNILQIANGNSVVADEILVGLLKWFCHDFASRKQYLNEFLAYINQNFVSTKILHSILGNEIVMLPEEISCRLQVREWSSIPGDQIPASLLAYKPVDDCKGVKLIFFSSCRVEKSYDSNLKCVVQSKVPDNIVQVLDLHTMTWHPPQKIPTFSLKGVAMCQFGNKICMIGGDLKSFYVMFDVATNSAEYMNCTGYDGKTNGILCAVQGFLYYVEPNNERKFINVDMFLPGKAIGSLALHVYCSHTTVATGWSRVTVAWGNPMKIMGFYPITKLLHKSSYPNITIVPADAKIFFAETNKLLYGFYQSKGDLTKFKYTSNDYWTAKVYSNSPPGIKEVTPVYRSSKDPHALIFVSSDESTLRLPDYLWEPEPCTWQKLPRPRGQCYIPEDEVVQKVYFVENYK